MSDVSVESYTTLRGVGQYEYEDRRSVFIGLASAVDSESSALEFIDAVKKKYPDAKHHVYAYVLRENSLMRFSDDREPQGTAGKPVLDVIRKNGLTDTVVAVVRYFGGTLLGTGGLVRAYTSAAIGAVENAQIIRYDVYVQMNIETSYSDYQRIMPIFDEFGFRIVDTKYTDNVTVEGSVRKTMYEIMADKLVQATSGRIKIEKTDEKFDF